MGHEVRLIPPAYVKPLVKRHKNDAVDAEAIGDGLVCLHSLAGPLSGSPAVDHSAARSG